MRKQLSQGAGSEVERVVADENKIILKFSDTEIERLRTMKKLEGYEDKPWSDWIMTKAFPRIIPNHDDVIIRSNKAMRKTWNSNIAHNLAYIRRHDARSFRTLLEEVGEKPGSAVVVAGGPSVGIHKHLDALHDSGYKGTIVSCDRMMRPLIDHGIIPDYVVTVDASDIILPFYKNPLFLANKDKIRVILHHTASPKLVRFLYKVGAKVYWFIVHTEFVINDDSESMAAVYMTSTKWNPHGLQTIVAGGNVGVASWAFSWAVLKKNPVMLIGMDMGYPEGTELGKTYYYSTIFKTVSAASPNEKVASLITATQYDREYNPAWKCYTYTDMVFQGYRQIFYLYLEQSPRNLVTINCTEGGSLNHYRLRPEKFAEALRAHKD